MSEAQVFWVMVPVWVILIAEMTISGMEADRAGARIDQLQQRVQALEATPPEQQ